MHLLNPLLLSILYGEIVLYLTESLIFWQLNIPARKRRDEIRSKYAWGNLITAQEYFYMQMAVRFISDDIACSSVCFKSHREGLACLVMSVFPNFTDGMYATCKVGKRHTAAMRSCVAQSRRHVLRPLKCLSGLWATLVRLYTYRCLLPCALGLSIYMTSQTCLVI